MNTLRASSQGGLDTEVTKEIILSMHGSGHALSWHAKLSLDSAGKPLKGVIV